MASARSSPAVRLSRSAVTALKATGMGRQPASSPAIHPASTSASTAFYAAPRSLTANQNTFSSASISASCIRSYSSAASSQISNSEFTEMAWDGILRAVDAAKDSKHQVVETEHLMKALLEQKYGLARRIFAKAGVDNMSLLQSTDDFISQQPNVSGDASGPIVGPHFTSLLENARKCKIY